MLINSLVTRQETCVSAAFWRRALWYALCLVLLWLYVSPLLLQDSFLRMNTDEAHYVWKAEHIARDLGTLATEQAWRRHPPLVPAVVGLLAKLMSLEMAVLVFTKSLALAGIVMVYMLGVQLKNPMAGLIAAVLLAADPTYRSLSNKLLLDITLMLCFVVCASLLLRGGRYKVWAVGVGILALLVKNYAVLVLVYALACIAWDFLTDRGWRPTKVMGLVLACAAFVFVPLGYYQEHIPRYNYLEWAVWLLHEAQLKVWSILDSSIGWMIEGVPKRYLAVLVVLAVPYVVKMLSYSTARANVVLSAWIATILVPFMFAYTGDQRVILLFAPALYLIVGVCFAQGLQLVQTPVVNRSLAAVLLLGCIGVLLLARKNPQVLFYTNCRFRAYHPTGEWIRHNVASSGTVVFTRSSHQLRFYARSDFERDGGIFYGEDEWTGVPETLPEFRQVLDKTEKPAFLVIDIEEKNDPPWLYPPTRDVAETIQALGFQIAHIVWVPVGEFCDIPASPYYSELPGFLKQLGLPLYRNSGSTREMVDAVIFKRNGRSSLAALKNLASRPLGD
jgi:Dolichyl-phosphate-mannose-protein mannosyltransferase